MTRPVHIPSRGRMRCLDTGEAIEFWRVRSRITLPVLALPPGASGWRHDVMLNACGQPRTRATMPGFRKGCKPGNAGHRYPPTPLTPDEALALLDACRKSPCGRRNRALFALLWRSGLRISEALALTPPDVDMEQGSVFVRCGKGSKARYSGIDQFGRDELAAWLAYRAGRGHTDDEPIFCVLEGRTKGRRMRSAQVRVSMQEAAQVAGIRKRVAPHQLRHSHACDLAREGVILPHIQRQLGHSNPGTTGTYLAGLPTTEAVTVVAARPAPVRLEETTGQGDDHE